jgi:hypothetical protein
VSVSLLYLFRGSVDGLVFCDIELEDVRAGCAGDVAGAEAIEGDFAFCKGADAEEDVIGAFLKELGCEFEADTAVC